MEFTVRNVPQPVPPVEYVLTMNEEEVLHLAAILWFHEKGNDPRIFNHLPADIQTRLRQASRPRRERWATNGLEGA